MENTGFFSDTIFTLKELNFTKKEIERLTFNKINTTIYLIPLNLLDFVSSLKVSFKANLKIHNFHNLVPLCPGCW